MDLGRFSPDPAEPRTLSACYRYVNDPDYRARVDAERSREQAKINAMIDAEIAKNRKYSDDDAPQRAERFSV